MRPLNGVTKLPVRGRRTDPKRQSASKRRTLERQAQRRAKAWVQA